MTSTGLDQGPLLRVPSSRLHALAWHPYVPTLLSGSNDQSVRAWDLSCATGSKTVAAAASRSAKAQEAVPAGQGVPERPPETASGAPYAAAGGGEPESLDVPAEHAFAEKLVAGVAAEPADGKGGLSDDSRTAAAPAPRKASRGGRQMLGAKPLVPLRNGQVCPGMLLQRAGRSEPAKHLSNLCQSLTQFTLCSG